MTPTVRACFLALADGVCHAPDVDRVTLWLAAEDSEFVRFNHGAVRQALRVAQAFATLAVIRGQRRAEATITLTGHVDADLAALLAQRTALTTELDGLADDPYLLCPDALVSSDREDTGSLPDADALIRQVADAARGLDFVGFYAAGPIVRAYADSRGQRNWHRVENFHFEWCLYLRRDKAVKTAYAGRRWDGAAFEERLREATEKLALLERPPRRIEPGLWRAWFTPTAMGELLGTLAWGGFGLKDRRTGVSTLRRLVSGEAAFDPRVTIREATALGVAPAFTAEGFARPDTVSLVEAGRSADALAAPRSAREFGVPTNGAEAEEQPQSLWMAPGALDAGDVLARLGTGLYISNLWYLNYSDRAHCRMTGMTRFACFYVEEGRMVEPLDVMRFDDSLLRMLGEGLEELGREAEALADSDTFEERHLRSVTTPGALVRDFRLTL